MDNGEIIQRVIGLLVETGEYRRGLMENPDREDDDSYGEVIDQLVGELLRVELSVPDHATIQDIGDLVGKTLGPRIYQLLGGMALAFHELADIHDQGQTDVSSAEALRRLALKVEGA
ncbi:hypothetical protein [Streptomyces chartreusis]|jgi:hypothetical protein|uniref:hypothetical protein n=1 Tax=Streptomyces chartreusis TaxID=1969 RepID=UPI002E16FE07